MYRTYLKDRENFLSDVRAKMDKRLYNDIIALAETRLKKFPGDMDAYLVLASCGASMDRPAEAGEIVEHWYDIVRDQSRVYEVLGDAYGRNKMPKEAKEAYMKCAALAPERSAHLSEKIASLKEGTMQESATSEEDEYNVGPDDLSAEFHTLTLAKLYVKQGYLEMAGNVLGKILERDPGNSEVREYAMHVERLMGKGWEPVIDELNRWLNGLREKRSQ